MGEIMVHLTKVQYEAGDQDGRDPDVKHPEMSPLGGASCRKGIMASMNRL